MRKFWTNASGSYKIDPETLQEFLNERGFYTFLPVNVKSKILVKVENKKVRQVTTKEIREYCWHYINSDYQFYSDEERKQVKTEFHRNKSYFSQDNLDLLSKIDIDEIKDTKEKSYVFFNNCILEITAESITKKSYNEVEGHVFETDIIDFDFNAEITDDYKPSGEFYEFIQDICKHQNKQTQNQNLDSMITIIGYLLHRQKDPANAKAIIFMDTYIDDNPNGGTGKGLSTKAFDKVRKSVFQDGKFFQSGNRFSFSDITHATRILIFDDVPRNFDFEKIFPLITEKAVVERKYENKFTIPFEESPKILITTNYTVEGQGTSHSRRKIEFIFSETYHDDYTPEDRFGHLLFEGWDYKEWEKFYYFIAYCLQMYLLTGIIVPKFNVGERKLKIAATPEFIKYVHENVGFGTKYNKKEVYDDFYSKNPDHHKIELPTFRNWLELFAQAYGFGFFETHSDNNLFFEFTVK